MGDPATPSISTLPSGYSHISPLSDVFEDRRRRMLLFVATPPRRSGCATLRAYSPDGLPNPKPSPTPNPANGLGRPTKGASTSPTHCVSTHPLRTRLIWSSHTIPTDAQMVCGPYSQPSQGPAISDPGMIPLSLPLQVRTAYSA